MKNLIYLFALSAILVSCRSQVAPPYTRVENIVRINPGMTASEVSSILGIPPFDLYNMAGDGSTIHQYYYKVKERKNKGCSLFMNDFYSKEQNLTVGNSFYSKEQALFVLYQNGKVASLVTSSGRDDAADLLVVNNTIQFIAKTNRHALMYEKLELGQSYIKLDSHGHFDKKSTDVGPLGKGKIKKQGCGPKGCR